MDIVNIPELVTAPDANNFEIIFNNRAGVTDPFTVSIEIVSGTWKFNVGKTAADSSATYTADDKVLITLGSGKNLNAKAANASETFKVSI
jgi:hypothetical protein